MATPYEPIPFQQIQPGSIDFAGIASILNTPRKSMTEAAFPSVLPLLQPGVDPYLQQAIDSIVQQGQLGKERTMADVTTAMGQRGLTGSSIESGDIAEASRLSEMGTQQQVSQMTYADQIGKRNQLVQFLVQAYGMDVQQATQLAESMAQLTGQELNRQTQMTLTREAIQAQKDAQPGWLQQLLPSLIQGGATLGAASLAGPVAPITKVFTEVKK